MKRLFFSFSLLALTILALNYSTASAQTLEAQAVSQTGTLPLNGVRVPLVYINLRASEADVTLKSVTLSRSGLSTSEDIGRVWLQKDYSRLSRARQFTNDDQLTLEFTKDFIVKANSTERIYVLANLEFKGGGRTLQINLENIESNAHFVDPVNNPTTTTTTKKATTPRPGVFTDSKSSYDRSQYKVQCKNSRCMLVKR